VLGGVILALLVHGTKAAARPVINGATLGFGAPVASTIEDGVSIGVSFVAIVLPILVLVFLAALIALIVWLVRRRRSRSRPPLPNRVPLDRP
jgi:heme/copper-type cytochrome/quinol oxidase subunit 2